MLVQSCKSLIFFWLLDGGEEEEASDQKPSVCENAPLIPHSLRNEDGMVRNGW